VTLVSVTPYPHMIHSVFVLTKNGEVIIEKHWRGVVSRTVCDLFWEEVTAAESHEAIPPFITTPKHYLVHIRAQEVFFLCVLASEVPPLMCLEFMQRVKDTFTTYFGKITPDTIKENFITVYQLLDEMMDNGFPLNTEPNVLREMVMRPTIINKMMDTMSQSPSTVATRLPEGTLSNIPWRKKGVRYAHNEIYFDIVESVDHVVDQNGQVVHQLIRGEIQCDCKLSGTPDILVELSDPSIMEDVSFHPCIRYNRFVRQRHLSFVPPDGPFTLCSYHNSRPFDSPVYVKPQIAIDEKGERVRVEMMVGSRFQGQKPLQSIELKTAFPQGLSSSTIETNVGSANFDEITKILTWKVGNLAKDTTPTLTGHLRPTDKMANVHSMPIVQVGFKIPKETISGLRISNMSLVNEKYKPYKGLRCMTRGGNVEVRC